MTDFENINYTAWNHFCFNIAKASDNDGVFGLNKSEIEVFRTTALNSGVSENTVASLLGANFKLNKSKISSAEFDEAIRYYNSELSSNERSQITYDTYNIGQEKLYNLEREIDEAFINCEAYQDILIIPQRRPKPDKLLNFDIYALRDITSKDMKALHELKENIILAIEKANETKNHENITPTKFDIEELAIKYLGMSFADFSVKYSKELEFCKTVTYADLYQMTEIQRYVYSTVKSYAKVLLTTTINEAHDVRWYSGNKLQEETNKYTDDMIKILDFESNGLSKQNFENLSSGIMKTSFLKALTSYLKANNIESVDSEDKNKTIKKVTKDGIVIITKDGKKFDITGKKIK